MWQLANPVKTGGWPLNAVFSQPKQSAVQVTLTTMTSV